MRDCDEMLLAIRTTIVLIGVFLASVPAFSQDAKVQDPGQQEASSASSALHVIEQRSVSITAYYITGTHCMALLQVGSLAQVQQMARTISEQADAWRSLDVQKLLENINDIGRSKGIRAEWSCAKFVTGVLDDVARQDQTWDKTGVVTIDYQDAGIAYQIRPTSYQKQVDIRERYSKYHGIGLATFLTRAVPVAVVGDPEITATDPAGYRAVKYESGANTRGVSTIDEELVVRHRVVRSGERVVSEEWYLMPIEVGAYRIPGLVLVAQPQPDAVVLLCYMLERCGVGEEVAKPFIQEPEVSARSLFVDNRVSPPTSYVLPESITSSLPEFVPVERLHNTLHNYMIEQDRLARTPEHPAIGPFTGRGRGIRSYTKLWLIGGALLLVIGGLVGYRAFRRRVA